MAHLWQEVAIICTGQHFELHLSTYDSGARGALQGWQVRHTMDRRPGPVCLPTKPSSAKRLP